MTGCSMISSASRRKRNRTSEARSSPVGVECRHTPQSWQCVPAPMGRERRHRRHTATDDNTILADSRADWKVRRDARAAGLGRWWAPRIAKSPDVLGSEWLLWDKVRGAGWNH